ncbi:NAD(P)H-hydrate dehydratase [Longimicrobium sp.]|uniref:NAD(P)H-hydrate dehydratase n=1 Tax=Longimicrobium sp. TaxID=2029185 RepID=UPI002BCA30C7|nr:NAD(P)H-hydrate dehydratase [Longimicrobium sp.]HSU15755.1 NAD(P)H-hydrate dehydratase [Longimicrobium sp.]
MPNRQPAPKSSSPDRAFFERETVPVLTADEMRAWDRRAIDRTGVPERVLMESAGRGVATVIQRLHPEGRVLVVCGSGNNGGDGLVAARTLRAWGRDAQVLAVGSRPPDDVLRHGWEMEIASLDELDAAIASAGVLVDALLGTGSTGAPRPPYDQVIRAMNGAGKPVVAVDGPSGIDFTTGAAAGEVVHAGVTVTFGAPKRGLLLFPGRAHAGRIVCVEIGFDPLADGFGAQLITPAWAAAHLPPVPPNAHKGQMGRVVIVAGRAGMAGASVLAGMGALRAGAGMAVLVAPDANRAIIQTAIPEALYEDRETVDGEVFAQAGAIVAGPGMGTDDGALALLRKIAAAADCPLLLDADATTLLARNPGLRDEIRQPLILTPHPGEASRLLGRATKDITADPFAAAAEMAERYRCTVLLKGAPSLVASPGDAALVSVSGHSGIATGGMGDTLSGVTGAFLALCRDPRTAAGLGLWYCGRAAEIAGRGRGLIPRDVAGAVPDALLESPSPESELGIAGLTLDLHAAY